MRIDKLLSRVGYGSRKAVKIMLKDGVVRINDDIVSDPKTKVDLSIDKVYVEDELVAYEEKVYIMMHKPYGYECTHSPDLYPSVLELLHHYRDDLIMVGRLDVDTEGLLLITNDGTFSHRISHGKKEVYKTYYVELEREFDQSYIKNLESGITLDYQKLKPATVKMLGARAIELSIAEGKYHQVKRMMQQCKNYVTYLKRIKIGDLELDPHLNPGEYRPLTEEELNYFI